MSKTIKKVAVNTILTITFLAMLIPVIIFAIVFVWGDYRGMDTIVFFEDSDYEIGKAHKEYAVFHREEGGSLFDHVTGYLHEDDYLYAVNKDQMMIIDLKKDKHQIKSLVDVTEGERLILKEIEKDPLVK
ncbi:hypothetical protein [Bacillus sp. REN10]|uniref:hypothetical protein n=1 Tax=Bacillus sp. REN10 TaxID=2782541 RepID=UPI00193C23B4|nr:hypothetical protein [Bacillus sp. REN10]